jgi:hypothetical protein
MSRAYQTVRNGQVVYRKAPSQATIQKRQQEARDQQEMFPELWQEVTEVLGVAGHPEFVYSISRQWCEKTISMKQLEALNSYFQKRAERLQKQAEDFAGVQELAVFTGTKWWLGEIVKLHEKGGVTIQVMENDHTGEHAGVKIWFKPVDKMRSEIDLEVGTKLWVKMKSVSKSENNPYFGMGYRVLKWEVQ